MEFIMRIVIFVGLLALVAIVAKVLNKTVKHPTEEEPLVELKEGDL